MKKIIILMAYQLFFVLLGCGDLREPCVDYIILNIKSPDGVSIGSYSGEILQNGRQRGSFYCENDQELLENFNNSGAFSCREGNNFVSIPAGYFSRNDVILSMDVIVYSFNKEMKSQTHFDVEFKYPDTDKLEGCETKTIEVILQ